MRNKVLDKIAAILAPSGVPHEFQRGKCNMQIRVAGRIVGVIPVNSSKHDRGHAEKNVISQVRRAIAGAQGAGLR